MALLEPSKVADFELGLHPRCDKLSTVPPSNVLIGDAQMVIVHSFDIEIRNQSSQNRFSLVARHPLDGAISITIASLVSKLENMSRLAKDTKFAYTFQRLRNT